MKTYPVEIVAIAMGRSVKCRFEDNQVLCAAGLVSKSIPIEVHHDSRDRKASQRAYNLKCEIQFRGWEVTLVATNEQPEASTK